jgi:hypothetical protein
MFSAARNTRTSSAPRWEAWKLAANEATLKLRIWNTAPNDDKAHTHAAYLAALDREQHAALVLGNRLRPRT